MSSLKSAIPPSIGSTTLREPVSGRRLGSSSRKKSKPNKPMQIPDDEPFIYADEVCLINLIHRLLKRPLMD